VEKQQLGSSNPPKGAYSRGLAAGAHVFVSGQVGIDPSTGRPHFDLRTQAQQALDNIAEVLHEVDLDLSDVVKTTVFLTDMADAPTMDEVYRSRFPAPFPTRSTIGVVSLGRNEFKIEVEAIALRR
jgi:2-iminobutanoate/2-iminopropanoate deaminase